MTTKEEFRTEFYRRMKEIREESAYGSFIGIAESYPEYVKQPYLFVADKNVDRGEKIRMLKVVTEISDYNPIKTLEYMFDLPERRYGEMLMASFKNTGRLRAMILEAYSYVSSARESGFDVKEEKKELERCVECLKTQEMIGDIIELFGALNEENLDDKGADVSETIH